MPAGQAQDGIGASGHTHSVDLNLVVAIIAGLVVLWAALLVLFWLLRPKGVPTREVLRLVPDVLRLLRSIIADRSAPLDVRVVLVGLLVWIVSPIDLIPEFLPGIGPLDDIIVAVVALRYTRRRLGAADLRARWPGSADGFALLLQVVGAG
jgi:uncharacterized membrane protein YkvA (DUF1232 family)